jgi:exopolysaccharide biosynthesis polyprenyl glycosylphosphotransferase
MYTAVVKTSEVLFGVARMPLDALAVLAALMLSFRLRQANVNLVPGFQFAETTSTLPPLSNYLTYFVLPSIVVFLILAAALGLYTLRSTSSAWRETWLACVASALWLVIVIAWYLLVLQQIFFSRAVLLYGVTSMAAFVVLGRASLTLLHRALLRAGLGRRTVVSVGSRALAMVARKTLEGDDHYSYLGHLPSLDALRRLAHQQDIDLVLQTDPDPSGEDTIALINYCRSTHVGYGFLPPVFADVPHLLQVERLGLLPLMRFQPTPLDGWGRVAKRLFDIVFSIILLVALSPVLLFTALAIFLDSGWPVFYRSVRVGEQGRKKIRVLKFRSMVKDADKQKPHLQKLNHRRDGPLFKVRNDPRVTRVGKFLRRSSIDELPQLFDVLRGEMSLVGPRPHLTEEVARYSLEQRRVFAVKPGVTGLSQITGRSDLAFEEEVRFDLQYIEEWSLALDVWILWRTLFTVFSRKGAD